VYIYCDALPTKRNGRSATYLYMEGRICKDGEQT